MNKLDVEAVHKIWGDWPKEGEKIERANMPETAPYCLIYIDPTKVGRLQGEIFNPYCEGPLAFDGLGELVLKVDSLYDDLQFPQKDREDRCFVRKKKKKYDHLAPYEPHYYVRRKVDYPTDRCGITLLLCTRFRRNGSWQGTISWLSENTQSNFISTLQCMKLIQEAVDVVTERKTQKT